MMKIGGGGSSTVEYAKHNQKAPEDVAFIREKTYTLPITPERELRIRARTKKRKKRRTEKPGGVPTHSRRSFPFQGTLGPFIREKTYTLPITLARGLRIRARTSDWKCENRVFTRNPRRC